MTSRVRPRVILVLVLVLSTAVLLIAADRTSHAKPMQRRSAMKCEAHSSKIKSESRISLKGNVCLLQLVQSVGSQPHVSAVNAHACRDCCLDVALVGRHRPLNTDRVAVAEEATERKDLRAPKKSG